jgi:spermidine/putrescine-binding protein
MRRILILLALLALVAAACGDDDGDAQALAEECAVDQVDGDLDLYNWSEYIEPELITGFEDAYGVKVSETFFDNNEAMLAQVEAGGAAYDVVVPSDYMVALMKQESLLVPLNKEAIPNLSNLDPTFVGLPFDEDGSVSAAYQWGTTGIGFSYEYVDDAADLTWGLIFDPDMSGPFAGAISMLNDERESMGAALKYLGYSVNSTDSAQIEEAGALIASAKERIATFDSDQFDDLLVTGETTLAHGYSGDFFSTFDENDAWEDFGYGIPIEGGVAWVDNMAIPITTDAPCTAHTFLNWILDAENGAALTNFNFYASPNAAAEPFVDPEILEDPAIYPPEDVMNRLEFIADVGDAATEYADAFTAAKS